MSVNLHQTLYNTADALNLHTRAIEIVGQNIANVNNENYAGRRIRISASPTMAICHGNKGGTSGILDLNVVTERDVLVDKQIVQSNIRLGKLERETQNNELLENLLGESFQLNAQGTVETGDIFSTKGISYELRQFFNACSGLSTNPTSSAERMNVISQGQNLVDQVHYLKARLEEMDENLSLRINGDVADVNSILEEIAIQTKKINEFETGYDSTTLAFELRESRQANLEKLGKLMNIQVSETSNSFKISCEDIDLLEGKWVAGTISFDGANFKLGTRTLAITEGALGGELETKTSRIRDMKNSLDDWVNSFVSNINEAYDVNDDGAKLFDGNDMSTFTFVATPTTLKTSSDDANDSANDRINAVVAVQDKKIDGATLEESYRSFIVKTAQNFKNAADSLESENLVQKMLLNQRENRIGVSLDSEMINLVKAQKAFQAAAKIITLIDELMDTVINMARH